MAEPKFNPTVPLWFYSMESDYVVGEGQTETWALIASGPLYCEWTGSFGAQLSAAQSMGVQDSATVRTFYHPDVEAAMRTKRVAVIKNTLTGALKKGVPDCDNLNVYQVWGAPDNVRQTNRVLEFRVRRWESL